MVICNFIGNYLDNLGQGSIGAPWEFAANFESYYAEILNDQYFRIPNLIPAGYLALSFTTLIFFSISLVCFFATRKQGSSLKAAIESSIFALSIVGIFEIGLIIIDGPFYWGVHAVNFPTLSWLTNVDLLIGSVTLDGFFLLMRRL